LFFVSYIYSDQLFTWKNDQKYFRNIVAEILQYFAEFALSNLTGERV